MLLGMLLPAAVSVEGLSEGRHCTLVKCPI